MNYLVTGGTGFLGSALVRRLVREGHHVRVLDNDLRGSETRLADIMPHIELVKADIRDAEAVRNACQGIEGVWHLAYVNGTEFFYLRPDLVLDIAVKGMVNIMEGARAEGIREFILASSSEVYQTPSRVPTDETSPLSVPDPLNPRYTYGGGKILAELMAIHQGSRHFEKVLIFRPHNVYGPDMGFEHVIPQFIMRMRDLCRKDGSSPLSFSIQGTGEETRAFVFIDDFINGLMILREKGEHCAIYHIGTMDEIAIRKVALEVASYFGREIIIVPGELAKGGTLRRCPDIGRLARLGYSPAISLHEGIGITARWYDEHADTMTRKTL
jgi:nucleoside-diphosphate-sugar epimerase